ncbi:MULTISPECIES: hypothetical protein [Bacillaceae]|uniref:Uncharacterized protein n=1 Tax=Caldibacillus thermoamylovorans TaxID=35841 RepID=A0A090KX00_9BACI|nr:MULTISPECIES: hypothetical protein [Bacillaceae]CEE03259.1 hypothetical protein BT1A1_3478 [Caldibacillus thermoamylovorans]
MFKKLGRKVGVILIIMSILLLMGCRYLDKYTAERIEKALTEKYGGTFEVLALGNRYGTMTNDYVQADVKAVDSDVVFSAKMSPKGEILADNYAGTLVSKQLEEMLNSKLESEGITVKSFMTGFGNVDAGEIEIGTSLDDYIAKHKPDFFGGYIVVKESPNNTGAALTKALQDTVHAVQNIEIRINVWVIPKENFDKIATDFSQLSDVDNSWFDDKDTLSNFLVFVNSKGADIDENELNQLLQGGDKKFQ